ncbi:hypothetical protein GR28A_00168 [Vibrio phage vB_VcorM_GR28A]|nr:hypothetical protein GR28A_00168 [Vibrio phage vB_VcorM_GR28A]
MPQIVSELNILNTVSSTQYIIVYDRDNDHELYITKVENFRGSSVFYGNGTPPLEPNNTVTDRLITTWLDGDIFIQEDANMRVWIWDEDNIQWRKKGILQASRRVTPDQLNGNGARKSDEGNRDQVTATSIVDDFVHPDLNDGDFLILADRGLAFGPYDSETGLDLTLNGMKSASFIRNARTKIIEKDAADTDIDAITSAVSDPLSYTGRPMDGDELIIYITGHSQSGGYRYRYSENRYNSSVESDELDKNLDGYLGTDRANPIRYDGRSPSIFGYTDETPEFPTQDDTKYREGDSVLVARKGQLLVGYKYGVDPATVTTVGDYFERSLSIAGSKVHRKSGAPFVDDAMFADGDLGIFDNYRTARQYADYKSGKSTVDDAWGKEFTVLRAFVNIDWEFGDDETATFSTKPSEWIAETGTMPVVGDTLRTIQGLMMTSRPVTAVDYENDSLTLGASSSSLIRGTIHLDLSNTTSQASTFSMPTSAANSLYGTIGLDPRVNDSVIYGVSGSSTGKRRRFTLTARTNAGVLTWRVDNPDAAMIHDLEDTERPDRNNNDFSTGDYALCNDMKLYGPYDETAATKEAAWPEKADLNRGVYLTDTGSVDGGTVRRITLVNGVIGTEIR